MRPFTVNLMRGLLLTAFALVLATPRVVLAEVATADPATGVLVVVPDRGFLGNDEVRDAFNAFATGRNAELLFITDARSETVLDDALARLHRQGAKHLIVLPLVLSTADSRWQRASAWLDSRRAQGEHLVVAQAYGESYLAVEDLSARLRHVHGDSSRLLLLGYGATDAESAAMMAADLERLGGFASSLPADAIEAVVYPLRDASAADSLREQVTAAVRDAHGSLVVPLALAPRADSMMSFAAWFGRELPEDAELLDSPLADTQALSQWMEYATAKAGIELMPLAAQQLGVVALTHGADWFWNRDIRTALAPVAARYKVAWAFSMADQPVVERAVRQLETEGVRAIVVVRGFGMAASFRPTVERMIGADVEQGGVPHDGHDASMGMMHHGGDHHAGLAASPRIRSAVPMVTVGGVEDDPLFARALLQNARSVSRDPSRETIILVAHGQGDDAANQGWLDLLQSLATQMRTQGGDAFRAIEYATWREDWPDKNKVEVARVRKMVVDAAADGGRALIVPARINGRGAADRYLEGLDYGWSQGFAQTPYFAEWFEQEVERGIRMFQNQPVSAPSAPAAHKHH